MPTYSLLDLDDDVLTANSSVNTSISYYLDVKSLVNLSLVCTQSRDLFKSAVEAGLMLKYALQGNEAKVLEMCAKNPDLLFIKAQGQDYVVDYQGKRRTVVGSTYQALLGAGDVTLLRKLQPYVDNFADIAQQQRQQQFPEGIQPPKDKYDFDKIIAAISNEQFVDGKVSDATNAVLNEFRDYFAPSVVKTGAHFNLQAVVDADKAYGTVFCTSWQMPKDRNKCSLFFSKVIGYLHRLVPSCDAQAILQGLNIVALNHCELMQRGFKFNDGTDYYPSVETAQRGLGFEYSVYTAWYPGLVPSYELNYGDLGGAVCTQMENYIEQKNKALEDLFSVTKNELQATLKL